MSRSAPGLDALQDALAAGDVAGARRALLRLSERELELFREEIGDEAADRAVKAAARGRRRAKLGNVLVLPGIMGSELESVDRSGDADRIWLNFLRLIAGRIDDLELDENGSAAKLGVQVRTAGVHRKTYVPLLMELDTSWNVRPFAYDWREDVDKSAARLDGEVRAFGAGEPVHLVAHSMGGLVSRRFLQIHRDTWRAMDDPSGRGRGGRLVMLGTPNRGSFAIPLTLTGMEKVVQTLARADLRHDLGQLLAILSSFPGLYQMLPSPRVSLGDDHSKLFEAASWGEVPVRKPLLARGHSFLRELHDVVDPQRLFYIAGVNQPTPAKIRIDAPGRFSYRETLDGDGRVPHELGLLEGVATYWVNEIHGDLAKNGDVLDAMTELLTSGETSVLSQTKPSKPLSRALRRGWLPAEELEPVPPAIDTILADAGRRRNGAPALTREEQVRLENLVFAEYLGSGETREPGIELEEVAAAPPVQPAPETAHRRPIKVEVVWGDVTMVEGDVYTVGHYEGVLPQRAELALDRVVSGVAPDDRDPDSRRLVITQHTRRGILRGALGDVSFFPWGGVEDRHRLVAIAGMGRPGTFDPADLRRLVRGLVLAVSALPHARTICTVLIGSGEGTLTIEQAVRGLIEGIEDAVDEIAASEEVTFAAPVDRLVVVELDRGRAAEIQEALRSELRHQHENDTRPPGLELRRAVRRGEGGTVSVEHALALLADAALTAAGAPSGSRESRALSALVESMGGNQAVRRLALETLQSEGGRELKPTPLTRFRVERRAVEPGRAEIPVRISFWDDGRAIRAAAIHQAATVPERLVTVGGDLIDELIVRLTDPPTEAVDDLSALLYRLLVPAEFREALSSGPFVFELDRGMARLHWELLAGAVQENGSTPKPLAVQARFARQLRTTYSPPPLPPSRPSGFRALVIGDPGDPDQGADLPGARNEALRVKELLEAHDDIEVDARIGAPSVPREGRLRGVEPADRLEVLALLLRGGYDLVHYAGHGDFDAEQPNRVGWVFAGGLLTPGEIGRLDRVPEIIVSNACLSARTSLTLEGNRRADAARTEAGLVPSLADEFFHLGVRNYVGTAWEVNDVGAELFAETFYGSLLAREPFGEAVRTAREVLWKERDLYGALWAAYQHYGDPTNEAVLG